ncbi:MAG TPA: hypothetical protein VEB60_01790 [Candidatus Paceibacterota bacterium]|nr:hypothetical protein [Candidatus Paceibacterota bacterium]
MSTSQNSPSTAVSPIEWEAYEYDHFERSSDWFWAIGVIAFFGIIIALLFKNFLFAIIIFLSAYLIVTIARREPELVEFSIDDRGIRAKHELYPYQHILSFWVHEEPLRNKLMIKSDRFFLPYIIIPLGEANPGRIRDHLAKILPEVKHEESLIDLVSEHLGF